jgi:hypothetical protein
MSGTEYEYTPPQVAWIGYLAILIAMAWQSATVLIRAWQGRQG